MDHYITGNAIRELREKKKITQKSLAQTLGVSDKTISKWETGVSHS
ncbi:helix-turn-helix transcriptional regulator [Eisenbergiella massiliensis]|uniref:XRE family transcriptional regulator n=1 Tax=Eisenbergiella massiliensis TaxID=1720294 RepID=A0A3E3IG32_9FIRM|nr:helix-turn-helix transcriptional regulator [Eisenbergiella massiliensis]RGE66009.1 XRE family transcriptional regulator [Eisenbergiella massiliensis]